MVATTNEQSKRLVAAGYNPHTADMHYAPVNNGNKCSASLVSYTEAIDAFKAGICSHWDILPCWSLSALWDIFVKSGIVLNFETDETTSSEVLIDMLVQNLVNAAEGKVDLEINEEFLKK